MLLDPDNDGYLDGFDVFSYAAFKESPFHGTEILDPTNHGWDWKSEWGYVESE